MKTIIFLIFCLLNLYQSQNLNKTPPFTNQSESQQENFSDNIYRVFLFKNTDYYGFIDFSGLITSISGKVYLFTNEENEILNKNGFYLGVGFSSKMSGSDIVLIKYYSSNETWEFSDCYISPDNERVIKKDSEFEQPSNPLLNNVYSLSSEIYTDLDLNKFDYKTLIVVEFQKDLTNLDNYDNQNLINWQNNKLPIIFAFGLLDSSGELAYHLIRNTVNKTYISKNVNSQVLTEYYTSDFYSNNGFKTIEYKVRVEENEDPKTKEAYYYSNDLWTSLPYNNFLEAIDYKNQKDTQVYLIADGSQTPNVFMFSTFKGDETEIQGTTYVLDKYDLYKVVKGVSLGIILGKRGMADGDFIMLDFAGIDSLDSEKWTAYDGYAFSSDPRNILKDSDCYKINNTIHTHFKDNPEYTNDNFTQYLDNYNSIYLTQEEQNIINDLNNNSTLYDNVEILFGENISPAWFRFEGNHTENFGSFKNLWVFNWKKTIPTNIDYYDWKDLKQWKLNRGYVSGAFIIKSNEGLVIYHGVNKANDTNLFDGSGLRTNNLELYNLSYMSTNMIRHYFICVFVLYSIYFS